MPADDFDAQFGAAREQFAMIEGGKKRGAKKPTPAPLASEDATAMAFAAKYEGRFAYDHTSRTWMEYDGAAWRRDNTGGVFDVCRRFVRELSALAPDPAMGKIRFADAVERAARADRRIAVSHAVWDTDPWLLGVPKGVVDLRTGDLIPAKPQQFIRRQASVTPAEYGVDAPLWHAFIREATRGDKELASFLQRLCGYFLTGDVSEEVLTFIYGPGGNGKGVFLGAVTAIMADYAVAVPVDVFTAGSRLNGEYYRAQMAGARLVTASETETGKTWAESQLKELSGNEAPVSAREPSCKAFTYRPQFKICIVGNHAPRLNGRSAAMERRLRILPFLHAPRDPDPDLKDKLRAEYPAILRWMMEGAAEWHEQRLGCPASVREATADYFEQQDAFGLWLDERCIRDGLLATKPATLLSDFLQWAKENGEQSLSFNAFAEHIDRTPGLKRAKSNGMRLIRGIGLRVSEQRDFGE